jgi:hypothetical protein
MSIVMALAMVAAWTVWASEQVNPGESVEITGTLLEGGTLLDEAGQHYVLVQDEAAIKLMRHVDETVAVKGTLTGRREGAPIIKIESYQVVQP